MSKETRRKIKIAFSLLASLIIGFFIVSNLMPRDSSWIKFQTMPGGFTPGQQEIITTAAIDWDEKFGCGRTIEVIPWAGELVQTFSDGRKEIATEEAGAGYIKVLTTTVGLFNTDDFKAQMRNDVLHAMTHACNTGEIKMFSQPEYYSGDKFIGYSGASLEVVTKDGEKTRVNDLEEAIAVMLAATFEGYGTGNPGYKRVGDLARSQFIDHSLQEVWQRVRENNVPALVSMATGKKNPSFQDVISFLLEYDRVIRN